MPAQRVSQSEPEWRVAGERLHAITGQARGGNLLETKCGLRIYLSALDRFMTDPPICRPCAALTLPRPANPAPEDVRRP